MNEGTNGRRALPDDYDSNPERFLLARSVLAQYGLTHDVHVDVAERFAQERAELVVDVGCGAGALGRELRARGLACIGIDRSIAMLRRADGACICADAGRLPMSSDSMGAAAALYVLYHLDESRDALNEMKPILRPGGLVAVAAPSQFDSPEFADFISGFYSELRC